MYSQATTAHSVELSGVRADFFDAATLAHLVQSRARTLAQRVFIAAMLAAATLCTLGILVSPAGGSLYN